jgi:hypothetical protein
MGFLCFVPNWGFGTRGDDRLASVTFFEYLRQMSDDQLCEALITCDIQVLGFIKQEWNRRHPDDPIPLRAANPVPHKTQ